MNNKLIFFFCLIFVFGLSITACDNPQQLTNSNVYISIQEESISEVKRVVSLTSLSADIIYRLDKTKLVGIPGSSLLKKDARFQDLVRVSERRLQPDLERIMLLKPDLVIGAEGFSDQTLSKLEELGVKTISTKVDSWLALQNTIKILAKAIAANPAPLLENCQNFIPKEIDNQATTLVLISRQPMIAPNKNSWTGDLLTQFKRNNVVANLQSGSEFSGYVTLSREKILEIDPEVIIIVDPFRQGIIEQLKKEYFWSNLQAVKSENIYTFDYYGLVNPGSLQKIKETLVKLSNLTKK